MDRLPEAPDERRPPSLRRGIALYPTRSATPRTFTAGRVVRRLADSLGLRRSPPRGLDVGGGTGSWSIAVARKYPHVEATVLELPAVADIAREHVAAAGLASRIDVVAGDAMAGALPPGYDVFLLANLIHYWSPEGNRALLQRVRSAAEANSRLLLADFWTNPTHTEPLHAALMAGEFAVHVRDGDVYSVDEVRRWLSETGWRFVEHAPLVGPQSLIVAEAA